MTISTDIALAAAAALVIGAILGGAFHAWRTRGRQGRRARGAESSAVLRGVSYILANEPDMAIEEFTKAARINEDTIETYVALGNLFRQKGEFDRAIRIRQTIIMRPGVDARSKLRALFDMGLDYRKGGLIERAISCFEDVVRSDPKRVDAYEQLELLYEEMKDWENAYLMQEKVCKLRGTKDLGVLAHLSCEAGKALAENGEFSQARACFKHALGLDDGCMDAWLCLGDLNFKQGKIERALETWKRAAACQPALSFLAYQRLEKAFEGMDDPGILEDFLKECAKASGDAHSHMALAACLERRGLREEALVELTKAVSADPNCPEARLRLGRLLLELDKDEEVLEQYRELLARLDGHARRFQCSQCGYEMQEMAWRCPGCTRWDSIRPIVPQKPPAKPTPEAEEESIPKVAAGAGG